MEKIVGSAALQLVNEYPDGCIKGYMLDKHVEAVVKAYTKKAKELGCTYELVETDSGKNTGYTYFEFSS